MMGASMDARWQGAKKMMKALEERIDLLEFNAGYRKFGTLSSRIDKLEQWRSDQINHCEPVTCVNYKCTNKRIGLSKDCPHFDCADFPCDRPHSKRIGCYKKGNCLLCKGTRKVDIVKTIKTVDCPDCGDNV